MRIVVHGTRPKPKKYNSFIHVPAPLHIYLREYTVGTYDDAGSLL